MDITPEDLERYGYRPVETLPHDALIPFVRRYLYTKTVSSILYFALNIVLLGASVWSLTITIITDQQPVSGWVMHYMLGLFIAFLLVPLHEYLHVLAYRMLGARETSYMANLKKFYFAALANRFVANEREFRVIALAPLVVISLMVLMLLILVDEGWTVACLGALLMHTGMCSGDVALLSFFERHQDKNMVTFDDVPAKISYFYGKVKTGKG